MYRANAAAARRPRPSAASWSAANGANGANGAVFEAARLRPLMERSAGSQIVRIALLDGPVATEHPALAGARILQANDRIDRSLNPSEARRHGTMVAGILVADRQASAPGICPGCTVLSHPIFKDDHEARLPRAQSSAVANAILASIADGASIINISAAFDPPAAGDISLIKVLDYAASKGVLIVAAVGNHAAICSSPLTRHPATLPVVAADEGGRPLGMSNLSVSAGRYGLSAPGREIVSTDPGGGFSVNSGTSVAAPVVTGTVALLWSICPSFPLAEIRWAMRRGASLRRRTIIPPLLDATAALTLLSRGA